MKSIGLIACSGKKLSRAAPAADLYVSPLFKMSRKWVEERCGSWFILSAKWGLLAPTKIIGPYNETLGKMLKVDRELWAARTKADIIRQLPAELIVLAGELYLTALDGLEYEAPLKGLSIGKRLQKLSMEIGRRSSFF